MKNLITHVTGYDCEGEATVETLYLTDDELADRLGSDELAAALLANGRLGEHDEWVAGPIS